MSSKESLRPGVNPPPLSTICQTRKALLQDINSAAVLRLRGVLLNWPRFPNLMWGLALLPLNQRFVTGDKSKSWFGRCFLSTPVDSLHCSRELFKPFRPLLIPIPFKPEYNLLGHSVWMESHLKKGDTRETNGKKKRGGGGGLPTARHCYKPVHHTKILWYQPKYTEHNGRCYCAALYEEKRKCR